MIQTVRNSPRKSTNKSGTIQIDEKEYVVVLRDISPDGARLRVMGNVTPPDRFKLIAPREHIEAECTVVWRRGSDIGVKFET